MGFRSVRTPRPRPTDHPSTKKAGLRQLYKEAVGPQPKLPVADILRKLRGSPTGTLPPPPRAPITNDMLDLVEATRGSIPKAPPIAPAKPPGPWAAYTNRMQEMGNAAKAQRDAQFQGVNAHKRLEGLDMSGATPNANSAINTAAGKALDFAKSPTGKKVLGGGAAAGLVGGGLAMRGGGSPSPAAPAKAEPNFLTLADLPNFEPPPLQEPPTSSTMMGEPGKPGQVAQTLGKYAPYIAGGALGVGGLAYLMHRLSAARRQKQQQKLLPYVLKAAEDTSAFEQEHPLVAGFLRACGDADLGEQEIREKIAQACEMDPAIGEAFEKCGMGSFGGLAGNNNFMDIGQRAQLDKLPKPAAPAAPKFNPPPRPAPQGSVATPNDYRGKGEIGGLEFTPARADYMKTWGQLDAEQGINPNGEVAPRYGALESIVPGLKGAIGGTAGAIGNFGGAIVQGGTQITDGLGLTDNWTEGVGDYRVHAQDVRDRGFHQMLKNQRSRALDDYQTNAAQNVAEHGGGLANRSVATGNATLNTAANLAPYAAPFKLTPGKGMLPGLAAPGGWAGVAATAATTARPIAENIESEFIRGNAETAQPQRGPDGQMRVGFGGDPQSYGFDEVSPMAAQRAAQGLTSDDFGGRVPQSLKTPSDRVAGRPDVSSVVNDEPTVPGEPQTNIGPLQGGAGSDAPGGNDLTTALDAQGQPITTPQQMKQLVGSAEKYLQQKVGDPETQRMMEEFVQSAQSGQPNPAMQEAVVAKLQEAGLDPQSAATAAGNMDWGSQLAMWLGLGLGTIGIINALTDEDGGIGNWLMGLLGLGIGGGLAASQGMLGQGAQDTVNGLAGQAGGFASQFFGGGQSQPPAPAMSPEAQQQTSGLSEKFPWLRRFTGGGSDPNGLDAGDAESLMTAWHGGQLDDNQVQQLAGSLPPELKRQVAEGVTRQQNSLDPRNLAIGGKLKQLQGFLQ